MTCQKSYAIIQTDTAMLWSWIVILNTVFIVVFHIQWEGDWINKSIPPNKMNLQRQNKQETHAANNIWPTFRILQISMHVEKEVQGSCLKRRQFYWSLMCCKGFIFWDTSEGCQIVRVSVFQLAKCPSVPSTRPQTVMILMEMVIFAFHLNWK